MQKKTLFFQIRGLSGVILLLLRLRPWIKSALRPGAKCIHILPPNPRGGDNTEKYCPRPKGRGQYFSVLSPPLGFGGRIWTLSFTLTIFEACHKSQYRPAPCVTGPRRKRCLNIDHGCVPWALRIWPSS